MVILGIVFGGLLGIILVIFIFGAGVYNNIISLKTQAENAWSQIKVQLNRRYDLIPNLVETVKGYLNHERETLEKVIQARNMAAGSSTVADSIKNDNILTGAMKSLFMVMEKYPDLKANQNVMQLQEEIVSTENKIAFARQHYNDSVMMLNRLIQSFPHNIIAGMFHFLPFDFFNVEDNEVLKRPDVKF